MVENLKKKPKDGKIRADSSGTMTRNREGAGSSQQLATSANNSLNYEVTGSPTEKLSPRATYTQEKFGDNSVGR